MKDTPPESQADLVAQVRLYSAVTEQPIQACGGPGGVDLEAERTDGAIPPARQVVILHTADPQK